MSETPAARRRRRKALPLPKTNVEYLILADAAEALNGKLYLMGGGWDTIQVANFDEPTRLSVACGIVVPWGETDDEHTLAVAIQDEDGNAIAPELDVSFKTGRAPTLRTGADTHRPFAIRARVTIPGPGTYAVVATIDGDVERVHRAVFHAEPRPAP